MTSAIVDSVELKARLAAIQQEACAAISVPCEAFPRWNARSETYPYWINRIMRVTAVDDNGDELGAYAYTVCGRFVVAQATADFDGSGDDLVDQIIPQVISYSDERAWLQSVAFPLSMNTLRECHYYDGTGYGLFALSVSGVQQVGCELYWRATFEQQLEQVYLG